MDDNYEWDSWVLNVIFIIINVDRKGKIFEILIRIILSLLNRNIGIIRDNY